ncbi:MAG: phenylacetate--CoA ligase family protein, partial [Lentisphaeria bacterium]|nr:phenylacetate--CoA ligase family protein [Lentisphaeria bacterium]
MTLYWNERAETMSRDELAARQVERLRATVVRARERNPLYRACLAGVDPGDIRTPEDIRRLPFMDKDSFRVSYPLGMLCVERSELREMHMSSGSTGTPVVMGYTEADLNQWAECMAR